MNRILALVFLVKLVWGQMGPMPIQSFPGPCPDLKADDSFEIDKILNVPWYQVKASDTVHWNESIKCIERRYTMEPNADAMQSQKYSVYNMRPIWVDSSLRTTNESGVFLHPIPPGGGETAWYHRVEITAVSTDYNTHLLMWGCLYNPRANVHYESGGISSRQRSISDETFQSIQTLLTEAGSGIQFQDVDWSDCRVRCE